jgi:transcriptional regulator with XRE-family HTH domain
MIVSYTIICNMGKTMTPQTPKLVAVLHNLGENIRLARLRRKLTTTMLAERSGMTRMTLRAVERGEPTVSLGAYANVLFSLGLEKDLSLLAKDDELGRKLQDAGLLSSKKSLRRSNHEEIG